MNGTWYPGVIEAATDSWGPRYYRVKLEGATVEVLPETLRPAPRG